MSIKVGSADECYLEPEQATYSTALEPQVDGRSLHKALELHWVS